MYSNRHAWAEIDLGAFEYNVRNIQAKVGENVNLIGVIKADAYGHGAVQCARVLDKCGVERFAVATVDEAIVLREAGFEQKILILGHVPMDSVDAIVNYGFTIVVSDAAFARILSKRAQALDKQVEIMVAVDTGMGRIGFRVATREEIAYATEQVCEMDELPGINIVGMFSHFSTSDETQREYTKLQLQRFNDFYEALASLGVNMEFCTIANSAAIMEYPTTYFDAVRPGIILYGCYPSSEVDKSKLSIRPVMSVKARVAHLKTVPAGTAISYGRKFTTERESRIATITLGYADGYSRRLSGNVEVLVNGHRAPVVGNICMDQCMIDVTDVPDVKLFDTVVVMGKSGDEEISADELAGKLGTINYEITCVFGLRLPKVFIGEEE